ncbi:MAG TPA: hypothetical protein VK778_16985 [Solirubrobacteraceae bacterium]|jgi:hypothetical protein|nr:hypothetical protein [Solirubrobacteraceae bacterium]
MSGAFLVVTSGVLLILALAATEALKQIVAREYDWWAPALAHFVIYLAGRIHPPRAREWHADVAYIQTVEGGSGLWIASSHLAAAPSLTGVALGRWLWVTITGSTFDPGDLAAALETGRQYLSTEDVEYLRFRAEEAGYPYDLADTVYFLAGMLVSMPRVVCFVRSPGGAMTGFTVEGAHSKRVCMAASIYTQHRRRIRMHRLSVVVVEDEVLNTVARIADMTANWFGSETPNSGCFLGVAFNAAPYERFLGSQSWAQETIDMSMARLAARILGDGSWATSSEHGPLIRIPTLSDCP